MSFTHDITEQWDSSGRRITATQQLTGSGQASLDDTVPKDSTDKALEIAFPVGALQSLYMLVTGANLTLETNDGATPDDTIALKDGIPLVWHTNGYFDCPITADVDAIYATEGGTANAVLKIEAIWDATP